MHEKNSASTTTSALQSLREDSQLLKTYLWARGGQDVGSEASVEYLQAMACIRLCLDRASDVLGESQDGSGKSAAARFLASYLEIQKVWEASSEQGWDVPRPLLLSSLLPLSS